MTKGNPKTRSGADDFETSLQSIMERLRKQAAEIAQLRRDLDTVRSSTPIVTPANGVSARDVGAAPDGESEDEKSPGRS